MCSSVKGYDFTQKQMITYFNPTLKIWSSSKYYCVYNGLRTLYVWQQMGFRTLLNFTYNSFLVITLNKRRNKVGSSKIVSVCKRGKNLVKQFSVKDNKLELRA